VQRIQSKKYFDAVQAYFVNHEDPARVYTFLLNTLWTDKYKLSEKMYPAFGRSTLKIRIFFPTPFLNIS